MKPTLIDGIPRHEKLVVPSIGKFYGDVDLGNGVTVKAFVFPVYDRLVVGIINHGVAEFENNHVCPLDVQDLLKVPLDWAENIADLINDQFDASRKTRYGSYAGHKENQYEKEDIGEKEDGDHASGQCGREAL